VCAPLRHLGVIEFQTHPHGESGKDNTIAVFKLQRVEEMEVLDAYMPKGWRNHHHLCAGNAAISTTISSFSSIPQPTPEAEYRAHVQRLFYANALVPVESPEWKRCLARGRYELRGIQNVLHVRKYRALRKRYDWSSQLSRTELEAAWAGDVAQVEQALLGLSNKDVYGYMEAENEEVSAQQMEVHTR
jgi:hypothetical protein